MRPGRSWSGIEECAWLNFWPQVGRRQSEFDSSCHCCGVVSGACGTPPRATGAGGNRKPSSGDYLPHYAPMHVGKPEVAAGIAVSEALVIDTQQVEDRRMQVMHMDGVFLHVHAQIIRGAVNHSAFHTATGQQH